MAKLNISEILITGYDGENAAFAMSLSPHRMRTIFMTEGSDGPIMDSACEVATPAFDSVLRVLADLEAFSSSSAAVAAR